ncbi:MAG: biopolymer transporter ExbD [Deltaproteobacteria bacterium]|nr:biopolymer transporter ExbD [Deltaproteobacteria bacterium]
MAGGTNSRRGIIAGINVTPLVDITLVLLVVFIVTAKIVVAPAVPLDLPRASQGQEVQVIFSVLLPRDGRLLVNGTPTANVAALEERARSALGGNSELRAVIQADGAVPHREVVSVLDTLKRAGVTRIAFGALPDATLGVKAE